MRWRDETETTDSLRARIEHDTGGKVQIVGEVVVGSGKTRATLHGGEVGLYSVTVDGDAEKALEVLASRLFDDLPPLF